MKNPKKFIEKELKDLDIKRGTRAYDLVSHHALEAADVLNKAELKRYIMDYLELLPVSLFE